MSRGLAFFRGKELSKCGYDILYEPYESANGPMATAMIIQSGLLEENGRPRKIRVLENAANVASVTSVLQQCAKQKAFANADSFEVHAGVSDTDLRYVGVEELLQMAKEKHWISFKPREQDVQGLSYRNAYFTHVFMNLSILFAQSDDGVLAETFRVLKPGGVALFSSWLDMGWVSNDSGDPLRLFPNSGWKDPTYIRRILTRHGFVDVKVETIEGKVEMDAAVDIVEMIVRFTLQRMLGPDNELDEEAQEEMIRETMRSYQGRIFDGTLKGWITCGRKPL